MTDIHDKDLARRRESLRLSPAATAVVLVALTGGLSLVPSLFTEPSGAGSVARQTAEVTEPVHHFSIAREINVIERSIDLAGSNVRAFYPDAKTALAVSVRSGTSIISAPSPEVLICVHGADGVKSFEGRVGAECATSSVIPGSCGSQLVIEKEAPMQGFTCDVFFTLLDQSSEK